MQKIPYIVTSATVLLAGLFAILKRYWAGFAYFVLACLLLLALFWAVWQIFKYCTDFQKELQEQFKLYKANKINSGVVTAKDFEANLTLYKKEFKKKSFKDKFAKISIIAFCFAIAVAFLVGMILL